MAFLAELGRWKWTTCSALVAACALLPYFWDAIHTTLSRTSLTGWSALYAALNFFKGMRDRQRAEAHESFLAGERQRLAKMNAHLRLYAAMHGVNTSNMHSFRAWCAHRCRRETAKEGKEGKSSPLDEYEMVLGRPRGRPHTESAQKDARSGNISAREEKTNGRLPEPVSILGTEKDDITEWRTFVTCALSPGNRRLKKLLEDGIQHMYVCDGESEGEVLQLFGEVMSHISAWDFTMMMWKQESSMDMKERVRMNTTLIPFPERFSNHVRLAFKELTAKKAEVLSCLPEGGGGGAQDSNFGRATAPVLLDLLADFGGGCFSAAKTKKSKTH